MATSIQTPETVAVAPAAKTGAPSLLFTVVAFAAIIIGAFSAIGGLGGAIYTYNTAAVENITTPDDAVFAEVPVRGPLSLWAQSDIITTHQLDRTGGLRYAEMERQIPAVDEAGQPVLDEAGEAVMVPNTARDSWISATTLTTVLGLGILSYAFSAFALAVGVIMVGLGLVTLKL
ncbi:MAG: hypothetical protein KG028_15245, partial [Actinobacteria bacterium]|nr:hypothetical protein [Actinomycetota bacterium]